MEPIMKGRKRAGRVVTGLFILGSFLSVAIQVCLSRMLDTPNTLAGLVSDPIPTISIFVAYIVWLIWLGRQAHTEILRGPLFPGKPEEADVP